MVLLSPHMSFCVSSDLGSSVPKLNAVAAGSTVFSGWRRNGSWA
jgi:hypothetical protein